MDSIVDPESITSNNQDPYDNRFYCKHNRIYREQLLNSDYPRYKDIECEGGFSVQPSSKSSGEWCSNCGKMFCPDPYCICRTPGDGSTLIINRVI